MKGVSISITFSLYHIEISNIQLTGGRFSLSKATIVPFQERALEHEYGKSPKHTLQWKQ